MVACFALSQAQIGPSGFVPRAVQYSNDDGQYHPDNSGQYVHDYNDANSGAYIHDPSGDYHETGQQYDQYRGSQNVGQAYVQQTVPNNFVGSVPVVGVSRYVNGVNTGRVNTDTVVVGSALVCHI